MKKKSKILSIWLIVLCMFFIVPSVYGEIQDFLPGDINNDSNVNMKDYATLSQYLNGWDVGVNAFAVDVDGDEKTSMKDLALLSQYLNGWDVSLNPGYSDEIDQVHYTKSVYGSSELGRDLVCYTFNEVNYSHTILLNFAIHGFEDEYEKDGQVLVDTANQLIAYYNANIEKLGTCRLMVIPCANPDGLLDGHTNDGFGRCNANGIDLNRDFDANYKAKLDNPRYYTPYAFSASESRALRDLVNANNPNIVIDFHGWLNYTIGDYELASVFKEELGLNHSVHFKSSNASGYFANWASQQGALSLLVEFTNSTSVSFEKLINAIDRFINQDYVSYPTNKDYETFAYIKTYALTSDRITTYEYIDIPFSTTSYIDGLVDECYILEVYDNGWVKVEYPTAAGTKVGFCELDEFISQEFRCDPYLLEVSDYVDVFQRDNLQTKYGTIYPEDQVYVVADNGTAYQVIYELTGSSGWRMGWILK